MDPDPAPAKNLDTDPSYYFTISENIIKLFHNSKIFSSKEVNLKIYSNVVKESLVLYHRKIILLFTSFLSPWIRIRRTPESRSGSGSEKLVVLNDPDKFSYLVHTLQWAIFRMMEGYWFYIYLHIRKEEKKI